MMDKYLSRSQPVRRALVSDREGMEETHNMADASFSPSPVSDVGEGESPPMQPAHIDYQILASSVAAHLKADIVTTIAEVLSLQLGPINAALESHSSRIATSESRIQEVDSALRDLHHTSRDHSKSIAYLLDKVDDLENRARRNNLRLVGLPESVPAKDLEHYCSVILPQALGISSPCKVERAHRIGPPRDNQKPRPVIIRYLDFADRRLLLQTFRAQQRLTAGGYDVLLFADYSPALAQKRRKFSDICKFLHDRHLKFSLAYPATLRVQDQEGRVLIFSSAEEANDYFRNRQDPVQSSPMKSPPRKKKA